MKEVITKIFENRKLAVEKIQSHGAISPAESWLENGVDELACVRKGSAVLELADRKIEMNAGDSYYIKANEKHRVGFTSPDCEWLCVFVKG